jgi:RNA polymerase sigma-70 factor (ECF subfamily)
MAASTQLEALYLAYAPFVRRARLRRGVHPSDLDDLVQETFVTVHRLLPGFEGRSSLSTWLYSVAWRSPPTTADVSAARCRAVT